MDHKYLKYLKYKEKYLNLKNQIGGAAVPRVRPDTNEWLYLPIIYRPFTSMNVFFNQEYDTAITAHNTTNRTNLPSLDQINKILIRFYYTRNILLDNIRNLESVGGYAFFNLKVKPDQQIRLLTECGLIDIVNTLADIFIRTMANKQFIYNTKRNYPLNNNSGILFNAGDILAPGTDLDCYQGDNKGGINYFQPKPGESKNNYKCVNAEKIYGGPVVKNTDVIDFDCGPEHLIISNIKVNPDTAGKKNYEYKCSNFGPLKVLKGSPPVRLMQSGTVNNLDKLNIMCPNDQMLRSLKLEKDASSNIKYEYECLDTFNGFKTKEFPPGINIQASIITSLIAENTECVFRPHNDELYKDYILVCFEGRMASMGSLNRVSKFKGNVIYVSDYSGSWYKHTIDKYIAYINFKIAQLNLRKIILYGVSMGAYAALYASCFINNAIVLSFSPQTFLRDNTKLSASNSFNLFGVDGIQDLRDLLFKYRNNSKRYIFVERSECDGFYCKEGAVESFFYDGINAGYLYNTPNTSIIIINKNRHQFTGDLKFDMFCDLLYRNFDTILANLETGGDLLRNNDLWHPTRP